MNSHPVLRDSSPLMEHPFLKKYAGEEAAPVEIGAVYYRRSNPPEEDWERDYRTAREDGHTLFRHWFTWASIHIAPDTFDWEPFDRHLALAAKYGIKTIIAEHIYEAPDWLYHRYPEARRELADGQTHSSAMGPSNGIGLTRMCLDKPEVLEEAKKFLFELGKHYRDKPGLYGYDIWNECSLYNAKDMCYCPATQNAFRAWLREKYGGNLDKLRNAWRRYSLTAWEEIEMPRQIQPFPDTVDMIRFQNDRAQELMKIRRDTIREADKKNFIVAHGNAKTFSDLPACGDDYRAAEFCDIYGYTFWYGNRCHALLGGDMIRIAAGGKEFWRAEAIGNSDWQDRGGRVKPLMEKEEMADPANIRLDALMSLAAGARGFINPRWRALQDGPLFDGYGWYNLDGSRSERSEEVRRIARWANDPALRSLWKSQPLRGQAGLLLLEESQIFCYSFYNNTDYYSLAYQGAYEAFLDAGIQADPIRLEHIGRYPLIYLPFPAALSDETIAKLSAWVEQGGVLAAEGCFGYFSAEGHAFEHQPSRGLEALTGARQNQVSFGPDKWQGLEFSTLYGRGGGGVFRQSYLPAGGRAIAWYDDGQIAGVENNFGKGKVRLMGTMAGYGYKLSGQEPRTATLVSGTGNAEYLRLFSSLLPFSGQRPRIRTDYNTGLIVRLWANDQDCFLWCLNPRSHDQEALVELDTQFVNPIKAIALRGESAGQSGPCLRFPVKAKDAVVYRLET